MLNRMEKDHIEHQPVRIGTLLVNEGFIRKADVAEAIDIQNKEAQFAELALGRLLVKKGLIDKHQLQQLLEHPELRESVGDFAVERGLIDPQQLAEALRRKPKQQPLAEALVAGGLLTDLDFRAFLEQQLDSMKLCELAVRLGMISETDLAKMVRAKRHQRTIGEILCDLNLITPLDLNSVLTKYRKHLRLGEILLKNKWIDQPTLEMALLEHESRAEPLGNILTQKKILTEDQLFAAFAVQYNIPFRKPEHFKFSDQQKTALTEIVGKAFSRQFRIAPPQPGGQYADGCHFRPGKSQGGAVPTLQTGGFANPMRSGHRVDHEASLRQSLSGRNIVSCFSKTAPFPEACR